ncbi:MAG: formamidopyrimidine-DNA glycosylase [Ilumatobacter coccineus]|uniref:Formamidopyrimidine-DNA glycosylase n=1 Tax=Ilumatobacter coccineus TaxID=467094 RepID=A0A2G6KBS5_9ACTN|nr:MAG: formamidopyrimidine-DNA glycosylase [Ilumatobacter coccineus]
MPEGLEAEIYRRSALKGVGRTIAAVEIDEFQAEAPDIAGVLPGLVVTGARRRGKLVLLDLGQGKDVVVLGLHFGMTGRLIVDGHSAIDELEYASGRDQPTWNRLVITFDDGGVMRVNDPRRLARFTLDPDEDRLGPDLLAVSRDELAAALGRRRRAIKAVLLDQTVIAGLGNLLVDEVLWRSGIAPARRSDEVSDDEIGVLHREMTTTLEVLLERGGSHRGVISPEVRSSQPACPRCGGGLTRDQVGGRTTIWCPRHQI